jgi:hypothetical protein
MQQISHREYLARLHFALEHDTLLGKKDMPHEEYEKAKQEATERAKMAWGGRIAVALNSRKKDSEQ